MAVMHLGQVVMVVEHAKVALELMGIEIFQTVRIIMNPALGMVVSLAFISLGKTMVLKVVVDIMVVVALNRPDLLEVVVVIMEV